MIKSYLVNSAQKNVSRWLVLFIDTFLVVQTFIAAYFIRFNFSLNFDLTQLFYEIPVIVILAIVSFLIIGSYKGIIRHTGLKDALNVYVGVSLLSGLMISVVLVNRILFINPRFTIPISIIVIHYLLNIILLITSRFVFKYIYGSIASSLNKPIPVLIYGAGEMGAIMYSTLNRDSESGFKIIGFIDDNKAIVGKKINRLPIFSAEEITDSFVREHKIKEIIIAIQKIKPRRLLAIVDSMYLLDIEVKIAPPISKWIHGDLQVKQIQQVKIEDLLERSPINLDNPLVKGELEGKTILVTGAAGSIGSEISRQIASYDCKQLVLVDQSESALYDLEQELKRNKTGNAKVLVADVRDLDCMSHVFASYQPHVVFHAAAYKHVPLMEENPYEAVKINVNGTKNIADLSMLYKVEKMVMVSTDKAVNPTNVMGATKRVAEMYVSCMNKKAAGAHQIHHH